MSSHINDEWNRAMRGRWTEGTNYSNRKTRDTLIANPSCGCISFMVTGSHRGLKQTGNSSEHSRDLMSSVQFIVDNFRKRLRQTSRIVLTTALGSTDHSSLMMRTSFRGSLSNAGNTTLSSSVIVTLNRCRQRIVLGQFARAIRKWISQSNI